MIGQTVIDMKEFLLIFIFIIFACGNATYILNSNREQGDEGDALYTESFSEGFGFFDAVLNQFIVTLGQADLEPYSKNDDTRNRNTMWILFIFA